MGNRFGYVNDNKPIAGKGMNCACLHGDPYENPDGSCGCNDAGVITPPAGSAFPQMQKRGNVNLVAAGVQGNCIGLVAPAGYAYQFDGVRCNMVVDYNYNPTQLNMAGKVNNALDSLQNALSGGSGVSGLVKIAAIGGIGWLILKSFSGSKGRTRERDVITKSY